MHRKPPCICDHADADAVRCDAGHCDFVEVGSPMAHSRCQVCWLRLHDEAHNRAYGGDGKVREAPGAPVAFAPRAAGWAPPPRPGAVVPCPSCPGSVGIKVRPGMAGGSLAKLLGGPPPASGWPRGWHDWPVVRDTHVRLLHELLATEVDPPDRAKGAGVLYCGGGKYWPMVAVGLRMLREVSSLPAQVWYRGEHEPVDPHDVADLPDVELIDATKYPARLHGGWESKTLALRHCGWERVLYLDADAYVIADPAPLLDLATPTHPFVFWQDLPDHDSAVTWEAFGVEREHGQAVPCVQGGQLAIHRAAFWRELALADWLNQHSDYAYHFGYGDQDMWRAALALTGQRYHCLGRAPWRHPAFVLPSPGAGRAPLIVHRTRGKEWDAPGSRYGMAMHLPGEARVKQHMERLKGATQDAAAVFGRIYRTRAWGPHAPSGTGSTEAEARPYLDFVNELIRERGWKRAVDLGCGDGYVCERLEAEEVVGVDVHAPLIERLRREQPDRDWHCLDIDRDREKLPPGDVALLKDVLHHWPNALLSSWSAWAKASGRWRYLVITNDHRQDADGQDCTLGGYRGLDPAMSPLRDVPGLVKLTSYLHKTVLLLDCGG